MRAEVLENEDKQSQNTQVLVGAEQGVWLIKEKTRVGWWQLFSPIWLSESLEIETRNYQGRKLCSEMQLHISCYVHYRDTERYTPWWLSKELSTTSAGGLFESCQLNPTGQTSRQTPLHLFCILPSKICFLSLIYIRPTNKLFMILIKWMRS